MPDALVASRQPCVLQSPSLRQAHGLRALHVEKGAKTDDTSLPYASANLPANPSKGPPAEPLRKQLKDKAKAQKASGHSKKRQHSVPGWELTVGIEIHAQLNTSRKLFSPAPNSFDDDPNSQVAYFDVAMPGSQPIFQPETLIPAIRAALALNCDIQRVSRFDRKHYFHWDQPAGYQITQFYEPFAKHGHITLYPRDGIAVEDGNGVRVDIQQIQMEQDTAKTTLKAEGRHWLDFNRAGAPLIEIITKPQIHHPATAAALVRKIQSILHSVDSCVSGMETGGLRADVNVSVRRADDLLAPLGTRVEIKNLSSLKAVEDAIMAERDRQIALLTGGEAVLAETRGFDGDSTLYLRGKEGAVDYRYMPDPDLGPVIISEDLVERLKTSTGVLPNTAIDELVNDYGLSETDAVALSLLENGGRAQFYYDVVDALEQRLQREGEGAHRKPSAGGGEQHRVLAANWILHVLGSLTSKRNSGGDLEMTVEGTCRIPAADLADILLYLYQRRITSAVAKELLHAVFRGDLADPAKCYADVTDAIEKENLWFNEISEEEYRELAQRAIQGEEELLQIVADNEKRLAGKLQYLVQKMRRLGSDEKMEGRKIARVLKETLEEHVKRLKDGQ